MFYIMYRSGSQLARGEADNLPEIFSAADVVVTGGWDSLAWRLDNTLGDECKFTHPDHEGVALFVRPDANGITMRAYNAV